MAVLDYLAGFFRILPLPRTLRQVHPGSGMDIRVVGDYHHGPIAAVVNDEMEH